MRKKKNQAEEEPRGREINPEEEEDTLPRDIQRIIDELGPQASKVTLKRWDEDANEWAHVETFTAEAFSVDAVKDAYGGGKYDAKFHAPGSGKIIGGTTFRVWGPPRHRRGEERDAGNASGEGPMMAFMMAYLEQMKERSQAEGAENPMALAMKIASQMQEATNHAVQTALEMFTKTKGQEWSFDDVLSALEKLGDLREQFGGGGGSGHWLQPVAAEVVKTLQLARGENVGKTGPTGAPRRTGQPNPGNAAPPWVAAMGAWMPQFMGWAQTGKPAEVMADLITVEAPDPVLDFLAANVGTPQFRDAFFLHFPNAANYRDWFVTLMDALADALNAEEEEAETPARPAVEEAQVVEEEETPPGEVTPGGARHDAATDAGG